VVAEVVTGDRVADVVAVGVVLVAAAGDDDRNLFDDVIQLLGQPVDRVADVFVELARLALVGRHRGQFFAALHDAPELVLGHLVADQERRSPGSEDDDHGGSEQEHRHAPQVGQRERVERDRDQTGDQGSRHHPSPGDGVHRLHSSKGRPAAERALPFSVRLDGRCHAGAGAVGRFRVSAMRGTGRLSPGIAVARAGR
jgi:hypothetical protein